MLSLKRVKEHCVTKRFKDVEGKCMTWRTRKNDRDEIVWPEVYKNGKGAITFGDVVGTGEKDSVRRDAPFFGDLEE